MKKYTLCFIVFIWLPVGIGLAQNQINSKQKKMIIDSISNQLKENYVFPNVADEMVSKLLYDYRKGVYKTISDPHEWANKLTENLQTVSNDKHLRVSFNPSIASELSEEFTRKDSLNFINTQKSKMKRENFGFHNLKILPGNIGYLDLREFVPTEFGGETAVSAMNFLSNTVAIIIDLRHNGGGSPGMIQLISSYLFTAEPVHLNDFYWRPTDTNTQSWTLSHVSGKRNPNALVYILTSKSTFSAAEEFSYNLKHLNRATIIGEVTGGGAHPGGLVDLVDGFSIWLPFGRAINPITNTNWEGKGVIPHIKVSANEALKVAQVKLLESLIVKTEEIHEKQYYRKQLKALCEDGIEEKIKRKNND